MGGSGVGGTPVATVPGMQQLPHHNLIAWQRADDLFITVHSLSRAFPDYERYELGSQLRRAALSVGANIVEGYGRRTVRDRVHFLRIAAASLGEVGYYLHAARRLGYVSEPAYRELEAQVRIESDAAREIRHADGHDIEVGRHGCLQNPGEKFLKNNPVQRH